MPLMTKQKKKFKPKKEEGKNQQSDDPLDEKNDELLLSSLICCFGNVRPSILVAHKLGSFSFSVKFQPRSLRPTICTDRRQAPLVEYFPKKT